MQFHNVLITGGAGFLGSHLCEQLLATGARVTVMDNLLTGSRRNIRNFESNAAFRWIDADVSNLWPADLGSVDQSKDRFDLVLHFACPASPIDFQKLPLEILRVDSIGTFHALEFARQQGARFILASTSEVYGDPLEHPQKETYWGHVNPIGLRSCYDETKRFAEATTMVYRRKYNVNTGMVRIFNTYGPRMRLDDGRVVPNFCGQALKGQALTVYGSGKQTRSFCYVNDLVSGILKLAESNYPDPVNIGNPDEYQIVDFARLILKSVPESKSQIQFVPPLHEDDPKQRKPDISLAKSVLGWQPRVTLEEGLKKTLEYFKASL